MIAVHRAALNQNAARAPSAALTLAAGLILGAMFLADLAIAQPLPARAVRRPLIDVAATQVGADRARDDFAVRGEGATLCSIDTGVDLASAGLRDRDDRSRVRFVFDPSGSARGQEPLLERAVGGAVWSGDDVDLAPRDHHGHGTAMAWLALGDDAEGAEDPGLRSGIAPEAALIVVRAFDPAQLGFPDDWVVRGVRFCREVARSDPAIDPRRTVILLSLGGHDGAHDSAGAFERAIVREADGIPVVVAAGNDGGRAIRAAGRIAATETARVEVGVPRSAIEDGHITLTLETDGEYAVQVGQAPLSPWLRVGSTRTTLWLDETPIEIAPSDDREDVVTMRIDAERSRTMTLSLRGPATFEVWLADAFLGPTIFTPTVGGAFARRDELIAIPATAPELIAVGASVNGGDRAGETAAFSARGPTVTGVPKPDLVAPGDGVRAPLAVDVDPFDPSNVIGGRGALVGEDGWVSLTGTSASAALVAGALLLALSIDGATGAEARARLIASARGEGWTPDRGYGELDVPELLARWTGSEFERRGFSFSATRALVPSDSFLFLTGRGDVDEVMLRGSDGMIARRSLSEGVLEIMWMPRARSVGSTYQITSEDADGSAQTIDVPVVFDRSEQGTLLASGGGCGVCSGDAAPPSTGVFMLLTLLIARRRARRRSAL